MKVFLIVIELCLLNSIQLISSFKLNNVKTAKLEHSFGHNSHGLTKVKDLNQSMEMALTLVTGSMANTQLVASYYETIQGLTLFDLTDMHVKLKGSVVLISQVFNTSFYEYICENGNRKTHCFASNSEVSIPESLRTVIIGILGLETILSLNSHSIMSKTILSSENLQPQTTYSYFIPPQVAQVYGFPNSDGSGIRVGIISLGGYFNQTDLDNYFSSNSLGTAPSINIVYVDGATMDFVDPNDESVENYLDVEIIASIVPKASITLYFAPNTFAGFYDAINSALQQSDVVSVSWAARESATSSYWTSYQTLFSTYSSVPVFIASGDYGSYDQFGYTTVWFPTSCPNAIGLYISYL